MNGGLPDLNYENLAPTRDYLQDVAKVLGKLQQAYLPAEPHDWQYGLEVTMRGITTQTFDVDGQPTRALIDLVRHKVRLGDHNWSLRETLPAQLLNDIQNRLNIKLDQPDFNSGVLQYDEAQADAYAQTLWWMEQQFSKLKNGIKTGTISPILLYPHHFDLALAWFAQNDDQQISLGFSTGDEDVPEPYIYLTSYPDTKKIKPSTPLPGLKWQAQGFEGLACLYSELGENSPAFTSIRSLLYNK